MRAKRAEVVSAVCVGLKLEERLVVGVVRGMLAEGGARGSWLRLRSQHRFCIRHFFHLLKEFGFRLDPETVETIKVLSTEFWLLNDF